MKMPEEIIKENGWVQISDESAIKEVVMKILSENPQSIADYKAGKDRALGFLVGQAMKQTKGKANPQMLNKMFIEELKKQLVKRNLYQLFYEKISTIAVDIKNKKLCTIFYFAIEFNFLDNEDFFLEAVFFTKTPLVQA